MKVKCALCNGKFEDYGDGDVFCETCFIKLDEFFNEARQITGDTEDFIDYQLLAEEMGKGLVVFDGKKLISTGDFPTWRI